MGQKIARHDGGEARKYREAAGLLRGEETAQAQELAGRYEVKADHIGAHLKALQDVGSLIRRARGDWHAYDVADYLVDLGWTPPPAIITITEDPSAEGRSTT